MINIYVIYFLLSIFIASMSQILLKLAARQTYSNTIREYLNIYVITGYSFMIGSTVLTTIAYKGIPLSYGPILNSLGYLLIGIMSWLILKEKITKRKLYGYLLIIIGIIITGMGNF